MRHDSPIVGIIEKVYETAENVKTFVFHLALESEPGQFVLVWIPGINEKPFSIARDYGGEFWLTVCDVGPFSHAFSMLSAGDKVGLRGPYGKGYSVPEKKQVLLVGGGYGMAPLHNLGIFHRAKGTQVTAITGARSAENVIFEQECRSSGFRTLVATDDGTAGEKGFVTDAMEKLLQSETFDLVQTCGPEKMMKKVAEMCREKGIPSEVSIERYMKCGFGVCGQCVVDGTGERMCTNGPVVDGEYALNHFPDFGVFHRGPEGQKIYWK